MGFDTISLSKMYSFDDENCSEKMPAANMRFGASGGVTPQNVSWELDHYYPA